MGTPLETLYTRVFSKLDEDLTGKESLIFALVDTAIARVYKTVRHSLSYTLTDLETYDGYFTETLDDDELELLAWHIVYAWDFREKQRLVKQRDYVGTPDFNRLPDKKTNLAVVESTLKTAENEIAKLTNDFNTYKYT
jgi:hypothetical protein